MKYTNIRSLAGILMLIFLAACAVAQDDPLNPADAGAIQDIRKTMGDDIFSPGQQDQKGNATPVIMGKNLPGSSVNSAVLPAQGEAPQPHQYLEPESAGQPGASCCSADVPV